MISDRELWDFANELVKQHGEGAILRAEKRRQELQKSGDTDGAATWALINARVMRLLREPAMGEQRQ